MHAASFRDLFPVTQNLVYLNHAAVGPLSVRAYEAMERHARDQREFGALHWREWYAEHEALRGAAAKLLGAAEPREIAILKNTSEGLSFVAEGLRWHEGDNVITTALEFASNYTPWKRLERRGVECRVVRGDGAYTVDDVASLIDGRTRLLTVSSVAFHNGFAAPLEELGALCRDRDVLFCVDAIQSVGVLPIDVQRCNISYLAADGHKWMCAPEGTALFYARASDRDRLEVLETGWTNVQRRGSFIDVGTELLPDARRFEAGSMNTNGVFGLHAAINLLLEIGIETIYRQAMTVAESLAQALESRGFRLGLPRPLRSPIVGAFPPHGDGKELIRLHSALEKEGIVCAPREGMLRFSPHFYNDASDVERVVAALEKMKN